MPPRRTFSEHRTSHEPHRHHCPRRARPDPQPRPSVAAGAAERGRDGGPLHPDRRHARCGRPHRGARRRDAGRAHAAPVRPVGRRRARPLPPPVGYVPRPPGTRRKRARVMGLRGVPGGTGAHGQRPGRRPDAVRPSHPALTPDCKGECDSPLRFTPDLLHSLSEVASWKKRICW